MALLLSLGAFVAAGEAVRADGGAPNLAYVVGGGAGAGDLVVIDIAKRRITGQVVIGGDPRGVALSLDARSVYVAQAARDRVAVVDARALRVTSTLPAGHTPVAVAIDTAVTGDLFVANAAGNSVTVLDPKQARVLATIPVGQQPSSIYVASPTSGIANPNDPEVYVANAQSDTLSVISATRRQVIATIPAPGGPVGVVVPGADGVAYVSTRAGTILAVSLADHHLLGTLLRLSDGAAPGQMDYDALTGEIYVPDPAGEVVQVLRPARAGEQGSVPSLPAEPARTLPLAGGPAAVAITFEGALGFVAAHDTGQVVMFDVATRRTLATLAVGGAPRAIMTGAYPPAPAAAGGAGALVGWVLGGLAVLALAGFGVRWLAMHGLRPRQNSQRAEGHQLRSAKRENRA